MAAYFAQGRLGTELSLLPLYFFEMLVDHSPDGDPWLRGETLEFIIKRMAMLSERDYAEVKSEVTLKLKAKKEKAILMANPIDVEDTVVTSTQECGWFGGAFTWDLLEEELYSYAV